MRILSGQIGDVEHISQGKDRVVEGGKHLRSRSGAHLAVIFV